MIDHKLLASVSHPRQEDKGHERGFATFTQSVARSIGASPAPRCGRRAVVDGAPGERVLHASPPKVGDLAQ